VAHAGQEINGPDGFRLLLLRTGDETGGELLEMEAGYAGTGNLPPNHMHPRQVERFEVLEGSVRTIIDGVERDYGTGESFEVPAGTPHQMTADVPARVRWQVEPALRTAEFFERLYAAMAGEGRDGEDLLAEFSDEFRLVATP
jgi:mannose-6-phosphate isomerase-like protein (cupin superfamily)